jgi:membrane protein required for colicin V production
VATLDWVVALVLLVSVLLGLWRGLVYEVLSVLGWIAAFVAAQWFGAAAGEELPMGGAPGALRHAAGFVAVFVGVLIASGVLAWILKKLVDATLLRPVDRALGGLFGLARGIVLVLALAVVVHLTAWKDAAWWRDSMTAGIATAALRGLKPVVPEELGQHLPA